MHLCSYQLCFQTPAFLGNAQQQGQWRTPPIKALLRQWWRVAYAAQQNFNVDVAALRREEALLFGHAWLESDFTIDADGASRKTAARQSTIRIRLVPAETHKVAWSAGTQQGVQPMPTDLGTSYAWYGLVKRPDLPDRIGIKAGSAEGIQILSLAAPEAAMPQLEKTVSLIAAFGTLGSRSRGGWGSLHIHEAPSLSLAELHSHSRLIDMCLRSDWAMSLASDANGLCVWHSKQTFASWDKAMPFIAMARKYARGVLDKNLRVALGFAGAGRMPSPLRWKVIPEGNALRVRVFAMPHAIPQGAGESLSFAQLEDAWRTVCAELDSAQNLQRLNNA